MAPFGYSWIEQRSNGRREKKIEVDAAEGEIVKQIFGEYLKRQKVDRHAT